MKEFKLTVWTNGKSIRKYTGQDKNPDYNYDKRKGSWFKATATIRPDVLDKEEGVEDSR
ncbi:hypothetical protein 015DV002_37 [Bacillus phage 015DV002]|nr:hypothetical protein 000TH008_51 [Bacillus phage 000TH008]QQO40745.1 hypothetical protein 000TH009_51 [Bacillus phage 000TH009]QQO40994.1 hypothetical protein 015DV002_37 [Bacillus phage 015DV002]QQO41267.1 hypothetical protein 015DV004_51 [Bacillus phage 015DV004]